jgi:hypothetical protein
MWAIVTTERLSSVVRPSVNFSHFNQLLWSQFEPNFGGMAPFQNCVRWSRLPTKMATELKIEKRGDDILIVHCCFSISQNCVRQPHPPCKMAAVTKNRYFFNCPLLL